MARIDPTRPDLIASRYDGLPAGPSLEYSFETQESIPVDNSNPLLRDYSPFTLRMVLPEVLGNVSGVDVNLLGRANQDTGSFESYSNQVRNAFGTASINPGNNYASEAQYRLGRLEQTISAGQVLSTAASSQERAVLTDRFTAADIVFQLERMLQVPPLTLFVNPSEISVTYSPVQQYQNRTRYALIFERWGEGQPTLSISGSSGGFTAGATTVSLGETNSVSGTQWASRRDSAAFQNFNALYHFYRNNGYIYDLIGKSEAQLMTGSIAIDWDQVTYVGNINSFEYSYQAETPNRLEWSMEFTVSRYFDTAESPVVVQPMEAPQPNPAYPGRPGPSQPRPDSPAAPLSRLTSGSFVSGTEGYAEAPLDLLLGNF
jgi:hypothetical protein